MMTLDELKSSDVKCGACRACCINDLIVLSPSKDNPRLYKCHLTASGHVVLNRKESGECVYLDDTGCSIHDRAPNVCKKFDCRVLYLTTPRPQRRRRLKQNPSMQAVYDAGLSRIESEAP